MKCHSVKMIISGKGAKLVLADLRKRHLTGNEDLGFLTTARRVSAGNPRGLSSFVRLDTASPFFFQTAVHPHPKASVRGRTASSFPNVRFRSSHAPSLTPTGSGLNLPGGSTPAHTQNLNLTPALQAPRAPALSLKNPELSFSVYVTAYLSSGIKHDMFKY